jgi:hypothetical protein
MLPLGIALIVVLQAVPMLPTLPTLPTLPHGGKALKLPAGGGEGGAPGACQLVPLPPAVARQAGSGSMVQGNGMLRVS